MNNTGLLNCVGNTPLIKPQNYLSQRGLKTELYCKYEGLNPGGSIKDRAALYIIEQAIQAGKITPETVIVEATSGNTGIGLAWVCAQKNLRLMLTMPESMSIERRKLLQAMGVELLLTPAAEGMQGAVDKALSLATSLPLAWLVDQFNNPDNALAHYHSTGPEIWQQRPGNIDILLATIGTGGTISGCGRFLKEQNPKLKVIGVEPAESPLLSQGQAGSHLIQGIGANFVPGILDMPLLDEVITVPGQQAIALAKAFGQAEGYLVGISSGAALAAAELLSQREEFSGKPIVTILPDRGERYLSTSLFDFDN